MSEKLSQEEVDALLQGVASGELDGPQEDVSPREAKAVDLLAQSAGAASQIPALEIIQGKLVRNLRRSLTTAFGRVPTVASPGAEVMKLSALTSRLKPPINVHLFEMPPLKERGVVSLSPELAFAMVECALGGTGSSEATPDRKEYSATENRLLKRIVVGMLRDVEQTWRSICKIGCRYMRLEVSPVALSRATDAGLAVAIHIEVTISTTPLSMQLCFPYSVVKLADQQLAAGGQAEGEGARTDWLPILQARLLEAEVAVGAELGTAVMPARRVLNWKVGDTITLATGRSQPIIVKVEGVEKFSGLPGVLNGSNAVEIAGPVGG